MSDETWQDSTAKLAEALGAFLQGCYRRIDAFAEACGGWEALREMAAQLPAEPEPRWALESYPDGVVLLDRGASAASLFALDEREAQIVVDALNAAEEDAA